MRGSVTETTFCSEVSVAGDTPLHVADRALREKMRVEIEALGDISVNWSTFQSEWEPEYAGSASGKLRGEVEGLVGNYYKAPGEDEPAPPAGLERAGLAELQTVVHDNAYRKGFWNDAPLLDEEDRLLAYVASKLALIHSEVSEALEELRDHGAEAVEKSGALYYHSDAGKPEGFASELADIVIRVLDLAGAYKIPLAEIVAEKIEYNATRPAKHGKAF